MKRTLLSVVLFMLALSAFAQQYDFAPVGARWTYSSLSEIPGDYSTYPRVVEVESEEFFQGRLCRKLVGIATSGLPDPFYVYSKQDSVFFYSEISGNFELLYDFGAEFGEIWTINGLNGADNTNMLTIEAGTSFSAAVGDTILQFLNITFALHPLDWGLQIIKGIGSDYFHLPYSFGLVGRNSPFQLRCYFDGQNEFQFVPFDCDTSIIISSDKEPISAGPEISVFPNPATDRLMVLWDKPGSRLLFTLYNHLGQPIRQQMLNPGSNDVEIANLVAGVYYWEASDETGRRQGGKIVKSPD
ncbi:MAG: T9SS type A sorting domain-containing protein [Saprospiraceae bacterium]